MPLVIGPVCVLCASRTSYTNEWVEVSSTHLPRSLEHNGMVRHLALGDAEGSEEPSHCHSSCAWGQLEDNTGISHWHQSQASVSTNDSLL